MSIFSGKRGRQAAVFAGEQLRLGQSQGNDALDAGYGQAKGQLDKASDLYGNLAASYQGGSELYQDALGANGREASDAARQSFTATPGYQFDLEQGMQALQRQRAVNGTLASGNADTDAMTFASGLASKDFNGWLDRLAGLDKNKLVATAGEAGTFGDIARLAYGTGTAKAGLASDTARGVASAGMEGFKAGDRADENRFGALMGGANLFARGIGALSGNPAAIGNLGSNASSLFSIFG